jgi:WD40 repeat protein
LQHTFQENFTSLDSLAFSPDGRILMFVSSNDAICLWDTLTGALLHCLHGHAATFSPDGKILASASNDNTLRLWDVATGIPRETLEVKGRITDLEFCANGSYLCTNLGYIEIQPSPESLFQSLRPAANIFLEEEQWVTSHDGTALWLPPEYRPSCSAVKDNTLALGHASGRVSILKICNFYTLF